MQRSVLIGLGASLLAGTAIASLPANSALAQPATPPMVVVAQPQRMQADLGGGFIEFLFGDNGRQPQYARPPRQDYYGEPPRASQPLYANTGPATDMTNGPEGYPIDPVYLRQEVPYDGPEAP
ncbi:MAG TPA: hypothetical protein VGC36_01645, partial [Rhizomicrobium sp.]